MSEAIVLTVPARHLQPGDHTAGFVVSTKTSFSDGTLEFKFVVPFTDAYMTVLVQARHLDAVSFPLTKRGDVHSTSARNRALGLPEGLHQAVYTATKAEPIAVYKAGTLIEDVKHFDRSMHIYFECPEHNRHYSSKDPYCSHWFLVGGDDWCPQGCPTPTDKHVLSHDYLPTRNG